MFWYWQRTLILILSISALTCKKRAEIRNPEPQIPEEFFGFYDQFHQDSVFQLEHILFPLSGIPAEDSLKSDTFTWTRDAWVMHKPFDNLGGTFKQSWYNVNSVIIEKITDGSGRFTMERRWAKMGEEWLMIYYKEMGM